MVELIMPCKLHIQILEKVFPRKIPIDDFGVWKVGVKIDQMIHGFGRAPDPGPRWNESYIYIYVYPTKNGIEKPG